jgi:MoxR-like ATPase
MSETTESGFSNAELETKIRQKAAKISAIEQEIQKVVVGQKKMVNRLLIGLFTNGHILLEGVPGLAKTLTISSVAQALHLVFKRIQFTPDLLPADLIGTLIYNQREASFEVKKGPIFANIVLADEINRSPAKVQSALLEAMQEKQVTIGENTYRLDLPFLVLATQNPVEQEGTYPLPEAQLDRFLVQVDVDYPTRATERDILIATTGAEEAEAHQVFTAEDLIRAQGVIRRMPVGDQVVEAILDLVRACRPGEPEGRDLEGSLSWGPGPRAAQALMLTVRARALLDGRLAPSIADVADLAQAVLVHRMALSFAARARGETLAGIISRVVSRTLRLEAAA